MISLKKRLSLTRSKPLADSWLDILQLANWCDATSTIQPINRPSCISLHRSHQAPHQTYLGGDGLFAIYISPLLADIYLAFLNHLTFTLFLICESIPRSQFSAMKLYASIVLALAALAAALAAAAPADAATNLEPRAGCSQMGQFCDDGTFLCCPGQGTCSGNEVCPINHLPI